MFSIRSSVPFPRLAIQLIRMSKAYSTEDDLLKTEIGNKLILTINRPNVHNCINLAINKEINHQLKNMDDRKCIILKSIGDKAFSAGGDLQEHETFTKSADKKLVFRFSAYLNQNLHILYKSKIPIITFANGIVYGGSTGYPVFSKYSIVTEKTLFSLPETKVGFYPNSGASFFLSRLKDKLGFYLGLTGCNLKGSDVVRAGLATHFCYSKNLQKLEDEILACPHQHSIADVIKNNCETDFPEFSLDPVMKNINEYFSESTVECIIKKLKGDQSIWAQKTVGVLGKASPTSLKVVLKQLQRGADMELKECLLMETCLVHGFTRHPDIYEGTKVLLRAKNELPKWNPPNLKEVTEEIVEDHFKAVYSNFDDMLSDLLYKELV